MSQQEFILWILGILGAVGVLLWLIYWVFRAKQLEREERRLMIERGVPLPAPPPAGWPGVKARELELAHEERRLRIEKGLPIPDPQSEAPKDPLRRGLTALALGLGVAAGAYVYFVFGRTVGTPSVEERNWFMFFAVISPVLILYGLANVVYATMTKDRRGEAVSGRDPVR